MNDILLYVFYGILVTAFLFLLRWFINWKATSEIKKRTKRMEDYRTKAKAKGVVINCPLCHSDLYPGEDLVSKVYRPMNVPDQLCTINGCPHCYPDPEVGIERVCPVCHKNVPVKDGHLIARLFNKADGKKHVIVSGCNKCCYGKWK